MGQEVFAFLVYVYAVAVPLRSNFKTEFLLVLILGFVWNVYRQGNGLSSIVKNQVFRAIMGYYALCILSLVYTAQTQATLNFIVLQGTLPLLPILFYKQLTRRQINTALLFFSLSCFCLSVYASVDITRQYFEKYPQHWEQLQLIDWTFFSYFLPQNIRFHAPYYSLYIGACLLIHGYFLYSTKLTKKKASFLLHLFFCVFYFGFQALLASRTALVATVLVMALVGVYLALRAGKYVVLVGVILFTIASSVLVFQKVTYLRIKFSESAGVTQRKMMWTSALDVIKAHPVLGVSPGETENALVDSYKANMFQEGVDSRFDAHNQFLMHGVSLGVLGALAFALVLYFLFREAIQKREFILFSFVAVFAICCLTESLMQRRDGTLLFSFMVALLVFAPKEHLHKS
ncbi:O-antigen ligase family protein [Rufibacter hautae]|uniref:O-antigen ligase family protein n=1 Tax=Rufibacter hautae TaxID=2595005 RepID=UPI001680CB81|nr:O-antigen ligase family protein [Rufibacter hautae]